MRRPTWRDAWFLVAAVLGCALILVSSAGVRTALLIPELLPAAPLRPLEALLPPPLEREERLDPAGETMARLYLPPDGSPHGAMVLVLGFNADLQDTTLQRFSRALARQGVVIMLLDAVRLEPERLSEANVAAEIQDIREQVVTAVQFLRRQPYVQPGRIGIAGFCIGGSLALAAAADPRIRADVRLVHDFGGFYSPESLVQAFTTNHVLWDGQYIEWTPNYVAYDWFVDLLRSAVPDPDERLAIAYLRARAFQVPEEELEEFSPEGRAVVRLLGNRDPAAAPALYEALPSDLRAQLAASSPADMLPGVMARVFIMQAGEDDYLPPVESQLVGRALAGRPDTVFTEFQLFRHMHPNVQLDPLGLAAEVAKLHNHLMLVLGELR